MTRVFTYNYPFSVFVNQHSIYASLFFCKLFAITFDGAPYQKSKYSIVTHSTYAHHIIFSKPLILLPAVDHCMLNVICPALQLVNARELTGIRKFWKDTAPHATTTMWFILHAETP